MPINDVSSLEMLGADVALKTPQWWERRDVWVTRDRRVIAIRDLGDGHLERIIQFMHSKAVRRHKRFISRVILKVVDQQFTEDNGLSSDHFMFDLDRLIAADPVKGLRRLPVYQALCAEADRRAAAQGFVPAPGEWVTSKPSRAITEAEAALAINDGWGG